MKKKIIAAVVAAIAALGCAAYYLNTNYVFVNKSVVHVEDVESINQYAFQAFLQGLQACKKNI